MIKVRGLSRSFGTFLAVNSLSFDVEEGEIFGFIGPNGAGKTTTIRILATLLPPSTGQAEILGWDVVEEAEKVRDVVGYMPDSWGVYPDITVVEYLEFFASAYGIPRKERRRTVGDVMDLTDLGPLSAKLVEDLSKGMKQRLCLAKTLIHDPRLLILDEPASGLDPRARIELRELLRELSAMGKTILISSHILTELSDLVTSVGIVERGRMLMSGGIDAIMERISHAAEDELDELDGEDRVEDGRLLRFKLRTTENHIRSALECLLSQPNLRDAAIASDQELVFAYRGEEERVADVVRGLAREGIDVLGLVELKADLESVFMAVTRGVVQ